MEAIDTIVKDIDGIKEIAARGAALQVVVLGKYNQGKSNLLNALVSEHRFAVDDIRKTISVDTHEAGDITWVDTPGLDADVDFRDDSLTWEAIWRGDVFLFVHSIVGGELDTDELAFLRKLAEKNKYIVLVVTKIDQAADRDQILAVIERQLAELPSSIEVVAVSSVYALHKHDKIREKSNIGSLLQLVEHAKEGLASRRKAELDELRDPIIFRIEALQKDLVSKRKKWIDELNGKKARFVEDQNKLSKLTSKGLVEGQNSSFFTEMILGFDFRDVWGG